MHLPQRTPRTQREDGKVKPKYWENIWFRTFKDESAILREYQIERKSLIFRLVCFREDAPSRNDGGNQRYSAPSLWTL